MGTSRALFVALLATGCAAGPAAMPARPSAVEGAAAPVVDLGGWEARDPALPAASTPPPAGPVSPYASPAAPASAQEAEPAPVVGGSRHRFSGGVGIRVRDGESALSLLAMYHYYVNRHLEIGALADWASNPIDSLLIAPAVWWHPNDRLTLFGAPGLEFVSGDGEAALRLGGSYAFQLANVRVRPFAWYDFVEDRDDSYAFGVSFGP